MSALEAAMPGHLFGARAVMHIDYRRGEARPVWITLSPSLSQQWEVEFTDIESMRTVAALINGRN